MPDHPEEWKRQRNGIVETFAIKRELKGGQMAPGAEAGTTVCVADSGPTATFLLLWQPLPHVGRGVAAPLLISGK